MKLLVAFVLMALISAQSDAQISVRVRKNPNGSDVDVKTSGKSNGNNSSKPASTEPKTNPGGSESKPPATDTLARPAGNATIDEAYNGPAKVPLKSFMRYLEKLRAGDRSPGNIGNAQRMLDQAKKADPNYNTSALEAELKPYVDQFNQNTASQNATKNQKEADEKFLRDTWQTLVPIYSKDDHMPTVSSGEEYKEKAANVDLTRFNSIKNGSGPVSPTAIKLVGDVLDDYNAYLDRSKLINWVYDYINKSKTGTPDDKMENLKQARLLCEGVLMLVPDRKDFKQKLEDLAKLTGNVNSDMAKFFTSDFHKENVNKIVFSSKPLVVGKEKEMASFIKTSFKPGEMVYGTVYLGRTVKEAQNGKPILRINFFVEHGREIRGEEYYIYVPDAEQSKSYFQFALVPDAQWVTDNYKNYIERNNWTLILVAEALADDHSDPVQKVNVELKFWASGAEQVKSDFQYDISDGAIALKNLSKKLRADHLAAVKLPKAGMSNPGLEQQMLAVANGLGWKDKYSRTIITSSEWHIKKNELTGAIIYRGLSAVCITKDDEGKCYYQEFTFTQDYTGAGGYSSKLKFGGYGGKKELTCDKIK
ncbi:MAG TPA: hypothetical protein PLO99_13825 [Chitinophagaceae bacterium]|nr:hypothetical protein [Chitinophagaceae bacterium]